MMDFKAVKFQHCTWLLSAFIELVMTNSRVPDFLCANVAKTNMAASELRAHFTVKFAMFFTYFLLNLLA